MHRVARVCQRHLSYLLNFASNHICGIDEARHFKFRVLFDTEEYECVHDILLPKGMCPQSRDLFVTSLNFGKISDSISETGQDRGIVAV